MRGARRHHGIDVTVLRLLDAERPRPPGGRVTYLAEVGRPVPAEPWTGALADDPRRQPWARPGGPGQDLAWADEILAVRRLARAGPAEQVRTWNLSSLWRLPLDGAAAWLKVVPAFMAHEGALLERLAGGPVPELLGHDAGRVLMAEIPGEDLYEAPLPLLRRMLPLLVDLQLEWIGRSDELLGLGLPDWRGPALSLGVVDVVERTADALSRDERRTLSALVDGLPERFRRLAECGLPDTLVHGDFHPGNVRGDERRLVLLDWGDSGVGHPLLDQPAFLGRIPAAAVESLREPWEAAWRSAIPGSDPSRAAELLAPIAAARQAVIYRRFLDAIEPSEHPYHADDPAEWLRRTAALARSG